jgi:hypothetical protein
MPEITVWAFGAHHRRAAFFSATLLLLSACTRRSEPPDFKLLTPQETGIDFANTINATDSFNVQTDVYIYNGAGVAVGDIDNDGLPDIFFSGNMVSSRLYLNKGSMRFADITKAAGVSTTQWATGASMVDINNDGYLDIYVSVSGPGQHSKPENKANLLFVNHGNRTFSEEAAKYGIADTGFTTQAAFLDYDRDGCLDLFLLLWESATRRPAASISYTTTTVQAGNKDTSPTSQRRPEFCTIRVTGLASLSVT